MNRIPHVLLADIVRRVGHHGFCELGPLIASGPDGKNIALDHIVLREVDIDEFIFVSPLANHDSVFRPFLLRCLDSGNKTAQYVEGLRLAVQNGPSQHSIDLLASAATQVIYSRFALGTFLICCGSFDVGMQVFSSFFMLLLTIEEAVGIAEMVLMEIRDMGTHRTGRYDHTLRFDSLPNCYLNNFSVQHLFPKCFAFMYAKKIQELC